LTQQTPPPLENSSKNRSLGIALLVVGLVVGLVLGIFISPIIRPTQSGAGTNNQVQVSGTVSESQTTIYFFSVNRTNPIDTSTPIVNGQYSILLLGGRSYNVGFYTSSYDAQYDLYVPLGVTTFTANFPLPS